MTDDLLRRLQRLEARELHLRRILEDALERVDAAEKNIGTTVHHQVVDTRGSSSSSGS